MNRNKNAKIALRYGALAATIALSFSACKKGDGVSQVYPPNLPSSCYMWGSTLTGAQADACCVGGKPKASPPAGQCPDAPGLAPTASTMNAFAGAASVGRGALGSVEALVGKSPTANNSAATAAIASPARQGSDSLNGSASGQGVSLARTAGSAGGHSGAGGGGAASGSGTGGFTDFNSVTTRTALQVAEQQLGTTESPAAAYAGGGGGAGKGGAQGGAGFDFGSLAGANGAGAAGRGSIDGMDFGNRSPASAVGSADPDDYFSRLKPGDSIFKVVEKRYGVTAKGWALGDAAGVSAAAKRLSR